MFEFFGTDVGKVALGGLIAILAQIVNTIFGWVKESYFIKKKRLQEAEYLAIRIVLLFDDLVGSLYNAVHDPLRTDEDGYTTSTVADPTLIMPTDVDYKAFPAQLMYAILSCPNQLVYIKEGLLSVSEFSDAPDYDAYFEYRIEEFSKFGLKVLDLLDKLCSQYRIPLPERPEHYSPRNSFIEEIAKIAGKNEVRRKFNSEIFSGIACLPK